MTYKIETSTNTTLVSDSNKQKNSPEGDNIALSILVVLIFFSSIALLIRIKQAKNKYLKE